MSPEHKHRDDPEHMFPVTDERVVISLPPQATTSGFLPRLNVCQPKRVGTRSGLPRQVILLEGDRVGHQTLAGPLGTRQRCVPPEVVGVLVLRLARAQHTQMRHG